MANDREHDLPGRLDGLQILRGLAAVAVLLHHTVQQANGAARPYAPKWLTTSGAAGVDVFFVISGFIMAWIAFRRPRSVPTASRFLMDRLTRVLPFYWLCCAAIVVVAAAGFMRSLDLSGGSVLASLLLWPHENRLLGVSWTLEYEMFFYLVFALFLPLRRAAPCLLGTGIAIALTIAVAGLLTGGPVRLFLGNPIMLEFVAGMALGWLYLRPQGLPRIPLWAALAGWAMLTLAPIWVPHETTDGLRGWSRALFWGLPSVVIVAHGLSASSAWPASLAWLRRSLVRLGDCSYALYLTHGFLMVGYAAALKRTGLGQLGQTPVVLGLTAGSICVAVAAHRFAELPLIRLARQISARSPAAPPPFSRPV